MSATCSISTDPLVGENIAKVSPMALAVLVLMTSSNCVGWVLASPQRVTERTRQYQVRNKTTLGMQV